MLQELYVENFALIESLRLPLAAGFNALSGETGAGKSLLIDAVSILLGSRASSNLIRAEKDSCLVEGVFCAPYSAELTAVVQEYGQEMPEDNLILTREINRGGKSTCRFNGRVVNLSFLRTVGRLLVNIHGQREHMSILDEEQQLRLLDSFGGQELLKLKEEVADCYTQYRLWQKKCREFADRKHEAAQKVDWLRFQLDEITAAALTSDEEQILEKDYTRLANSEKLQEAGKSSYQLLTEAQAALEQTAAAMQYLKTAADLDIEALAIYERLAGAYYELEDTAREISAYNDSLDADPYALAQVQERLELIHKLEKKYGGDIEAILAHAQEVQKELRQWENWDEDSSAARKYLEDAERRYQALAAQLRAKRQEAADRLGQAISTEFKLLYMPQATFKVQLNPCEMASHGTERVTFMICANIGEDFQPVEKTASGGELSRIILAIKVILAQLDQVPTLIFDEVDSGLGGVALDMVAQRMAKIAQYTQVLAITHAPLMAAAADQQIYIYKEISQGRTIVKCKLLTKEQRIQEIARMIAGGQISEATMEQAKRLLS